MLSGTGPGRNVATGETSPEDHAGAWQERWESSGASTVIELPGNQGTGWAGEEQVDCEGMYTDQAGCRDAAGRQAGASMDAYGKGWWLSRSWRPAYLAQTPV